MTLAVSAGLLVCGAVYLLLRRELLRVILGFILLGHAVNLILMASGGAAGRAAPFGTLDDTAGVADPLPQAFVLTAIVIAFSITIFLLSLAVTGEHDDDTVDVNDGDDVNDDTDARVGEASETAAQLEAYKGRVV
ncbi:MAG TPA: cation:proton antiporter subunit C [Cryobacterium sp.]|nr:cation:proton antiporter subunit C [Cryobacterium sp.]